MIITLIQKVQNMLRQISLLVATLVVAVTILLTSVVKAASIEYNFNQKPSPHPNYKPSVDIVYNLAYPGAILPDNLLWPLKAVRDKIWLTFTFNPTRRSELLLLMADKRLSASTALFKKGKGDLATSVLTKAEKYLDEAADMERIAQKDKHDTSNLLNKLSIGSLKHRQVIDEILTLAPEDAKPHIVETQNYSKTTYNEVKNRLLEIGVIAPRNPFNN